MTDTVQPIEPAFETTSGTAPNGEQAAGEQRHGRLETAAARLRTSGTPVPADRWFQVAGWVLVPLGAAFIVLGWYGTAHTTRVWEQMPFLVSGGLLGLGLLFAGGFAYYSYWLTRLLAASREQAERAHDLAEQQAATLARIEQLLQTQRGPTVAPSVDLAGEGLVATATGTMAHRPGCPMVAGKRNLRAVDPSDPAVTRCLVCEPELTPAANGAPKARATRRR